MNEHERKEWLLKQAEEVLRTVGLATGQVVMDFGCGRGAYTLPAANLVMPAQVYAVDRDLAVLEELARKSAENSLCNVTLIHSTDLKLPVAEQSMDMVLLFDVLHMVEGVPVLLEELNRVVKPDGRLCVYPMHLEADVLRDDMRQAGFVLTHEYYQGNILLFARP